MILAYNMINMITAKCEARPQPQPVRDRTARTLLLQNKGFETTIPYKIQPENRFVVAKPPQVMEMGTRTGMCCLEKT
jgi:hypothetical protein